MKKTAIVCAVLAGALGCATIASAQERDPHYNDNGDRIVPGTLIPQQHESPGYTGPAYRVYGSPGHAYDYGARSYDNRDGHYDHRDHDRADRDREHARADRDRDHDRADHDRADRDHDRRDHHDRYGRYERYDRGYADYDGYFRRGGYLPYEYRRPDYYVDWRSYPGLYAPPYGYQWVQVGNDFLLVALASGLIANLLTQ